MFMKYSLPFRILIAASLLLVFPLIVFSFLELRDAFYEQVSDAKKELIDVSSRRRDAFTALTSSKYLLLEEISYLLDIPKLLPNLPNEQINETLRHMVKMGDFWGLEFLKLPQTNASSMSLRKTLFI